MWYALVRSFIMPPVTHLLLEEWSLAMPVNAPIINLTELTAKVSGQRFNCETKIAARLSNLVKDIDQKQKNLVAAERNLQIFKDEIDNIMTEEQLISFIQNKGW